jgi:hypothetical protein
MAGRTVDCDASVSYQDGSRVILLVGGGATLTLVLNGTSCGGLLHALGLTDPPLARQVRGTRTALLRTNGSWPGR